MTEPNVAESAFTSGDPTGPPHDTSEGVIEELLALRRTCEAMEQTAFERERLIAWYAAQASTLKRRVQSQDEEIARLGATAGRALGLEARIDELLRSTSWRITLPIRVVRRPRTYLRKLMRR